MIRQASHDDIPRVHRSLLSLALPVGRVLFVVVVVSFWQPSQAWVDMVVQETKTTTGCTQSFSYDSKNSHYYYSPWRCRKQQRRQMIQQQHLRSRLADDTDTDADAGADTNTDTNDADPSSFFDSHRASFQHQQQQVQQWKEEGQRLRRDAERMEVQLIMHKIQILEEKMNHHHHRLSIHNNSFTRNTAVTKRLVVAQSVDHDEAAHVHAQHEQHHQEQLASLRRKLMEMIDRNASAGQSSSSSRSNRRRRIESNETVGEASIQSPQIASIPMDDALAKTLSILNQTLYIDAADSENVDYDEQDWSSLKDLMLETKGIATTELNRTTSDSSSSRTTFIDDSTVPLNIRDNDIDYVDRSRFITELYPSVAAMDGFVDLPESLVYAFCRRVLNDSNNSNKLRRRRIFMAQSRPERVMGGFYIRGSNLIENDDCTGRKLVQQIRSKLDEDQNRDLKDRINFYYVPDPSPASNDGPIATGFDEQQPLILLTGKNCAPQYSIPLAVSVLGCSSLVVYSLAVTLLQPAAAQGSLSLATMAIHHTGTIESVFAIIGSALAIIAVHETAHRIVAWIDQFEVGLPTVLPSIHFGALQCITPIKSNPPNFRSLFDFAMAGPMMGLLVSIGFLVVGLDLTTNMEYTQSSQLPGLPFYLLRSSTLGGELIELFVGHGTLMRELPGSTILPLHPFAISGFCGVVSNALALLPLGGTDGGRVCLAMFGRRGCYVVARFTPILLCFLGLFGLDQSAIVLFYNLLSIIWQRNLEMPMRNEVEEIDSGRGFFGICTAFLVALALTPMLS